MTLGPSVQVLLLVHVLFGTLTILAAVWVFVDVLNATTATVRRIRRVSLAVAACMWMTYLVGGYWYVAYYGIDKSAIVGGPWPFAHTVVMETKEHVALFLLVLTTYLPVAASANLATDRPARVLVLWVAGLIAATGLALDSAGAIIATGAKLALAAH